MAKIVFGSFLAFIVLVIAPFAVSAEVTTLRMAFQDSEQSHGYIHAVAPWARQVEEATKGRLKIDIYPSQTLCKGKDAWNALSSGIADIAWCFHGYWPNMTSLADVMSLPGLPFRTARKGSEVFWNVYEKFPAVRKQFEKNKVLLLFTSDPYVLITTNKWVKNLEDIKGLKLRMTGGPPTQMVNALGGTSVLIPMPDVFISLQKGVIDGLAAPWEAMHAFKFYEIVNYYTEGPFPAVYFSIAMNKAKWNSLPEDVQNAVMSVSGLKGSVFWGHNFFDTAKEVTIKDIHNRGKKFNMYILPDEERAKWLDIAGKPLWKNWVSDMENKGYKDARMILDTVLSSK